MTLDYDAYTKMLRVNKHRLDDELEVQADIQNDLNEAKTTAASREAQAKDDLDQCEAELFVNLTRKDSASKMTKDQADATIILDPERIQLWRKYQAAKAERARWDGLYDSWKSRGFDLKALGQLYADQYFAIDSAGARVERPQRPSAGQREHEQVREVAASARRRRVEG